VEKSGAWFSYGKDRIGQGRENSRAFLKENPAMLAEIESKIMDQAGLAAPSAGSKEKE
jgi:recombination protein RecA